jgi:hypothetical protein
LKSEMASLEPKPERKFRISEAVIRKRNLNTAWGIVFGVALCAITLRGHAVDSDKYNDTLLLSVLGFVILFCLFNLVGHFRYVRNSRKHHLEVGEDRITFVTGADESVLPLSEVALAERQSRLREGPSLMMRLKNKRVVRLVGYERQEDLIALVSQRIASIQALASRSE